MERKADKLLRKMHIKDYTNSLEKVLERKYFSIDTKNLLLSMLYKIENSYKDYSKTKVEVTEKADFLEKIIEIIEQKCNEIITKNDNVDVDTEFKVDKENGKIITIGNELALLESILKMGEGEITLTEEENIIKPSIDYFFNVATIMNQAEVIRDFNGWSWDISVKDIKNIRINLAFQILIYLLGNYFIQDWINNTSTLADYLILMSDYLKKNFGEKRENEILKLFCKISIEEKAKIDEKEQNMWNKKKEDTKSEVERLKDNVSYLEEITNTKKELTKKIEKIDKMINNQEQLKKEYDKRNAKLPNKDKIFSVRQLVNKMEVERQEYIDKIKECNDLLEPKSYVARKEKVNQEYEFLKKLDFKGENQNHDLKELCKLFLQCFRIKIEKTAIKQEIIEYVYELRYFGFLMIDKEKSVKDTESLHEEFEETVQALYKKAKDINAIEEITKDEDINFKIIKKIFDSKMIDLNNMVIKTKVKDEKLFIEYYDVNILETTIELQPEKTIKLNKKTKLFV